MTSRDVTGFRGPGMQSNEWEADHRLADEATQGEILRLLQDGATIQGRVFSTPLLTVPNIGAGAAYAALEAMGTLLRVAVPKAGVIYSATLIDRDDEGVQIDFWVFQDQVADGSDNNAYAPSDTDLASFLTLISFSQFFDGNTGQVSVATPIDYAYTAPGGFLYFQAQSRGTPTIAAGSEPQLKVQILMQGVGGL